VLRQRYRKPFPSQPFVNLNFQGWPNITVCDLNSKPYFLFSDAEPERRQVPEKEVIACVMSVLALTIIKMK
jgi:hypothetical protein